MKRCVGFYFILLISECILVRSDSNNFLSLLAFNGNEYFSIQFSFSSKSKFRAIKYKLFIKKKKRLNKNKTKSAYFPEYNGM